VKILKLRKPVPFHVSLLVGDAAPAAAAPAPLDAARLHQGADRALLLPLLALHGVEHRAPPVLLLLAVVLHQGEETCDAGHRQLHGAEHLLHGAEPQLHDAEHQIHLWRHPLNRAGVPDP